MIIHNKDGHSYPEGIIILIIRIASNHDHSNDNINTNTNHSTHKQNNKKENKEEEES